jgi:acyl-coenzyme A thioesterase PaaI-like protein
MLLLKNPKTAKLLINLWPPYLGTGIRVRFIADDWREVVVSMSLRCYNRNYVGSHFGGSLYAMTDPFYMLMLINNLGSEYRVWDQAGRIEYVKPGRGKVTATFKIGEDLLKKISVQTAGGEKYLEDLPITVSDAAGEIVARITRTLYFRRK